MGFFEPDKLNDNLKIVPRNRPPGLTISPAL
jgi:hypothetical protein